MTYHADLMRELSSLCLVMTLGHAEQFVSDIDSKRLSQQEYLYALGEAAGRIGGCAKYEPVQAQAAAARLAVRAGSLYDPRSGDQTLVVTKLVRHYLRYGPNDFRPELRTEGLGQILKLWVEVWLRAEAALDPAWRPGAAFEPFKPKVPLTESIEAGQSPASIRDPALRADYAAHLQRQAAFQQAQRDQLLVRRALDEAREDYLAYFEALAALPELKSARQRWAAALKDPALKAQLQR